MTDGERKPLVMAPPQLYVHYHGIIVDGLLLLSFMSWLASP
jgi:hypothetical protein